MKEQIAECCKKLRLSNNIVEISSQIEASSHEEYLLKILQHELKHRETTRKTRLIKQAGFYALKTFEDFCFDEIQLPAELSVEALKQADFIDDSQNLILYGNVGTGKTHLAQAVGIEACKKGKVVRFYRTAALVNKLSDAKAKGELEKFLKQLLKADLIICDEWGYIPLEFEGAKILFQVISECYEKTSIIITTNLEFSKWINVFFDEQMTAAMIDRLVHHSYLLLFEGKSYRIKNSLIQSYE